MPLISVIVPIYNVSAYLKRCVNSIIGQTYKDIEIILIDDDSTDDSGIICDQMGSRDERIRVFYKENGGLSSARNFGLLQSNGDYVCFIDSDDIIAEYYIEVLLKLCIDYHVDIAVARYSIFNGETFLFQRPTDEHIDFYSGKDAVNLLFGSDYVNYVVAWNKLYRKSLFDDIRYPEGKYNEDEAITYRLFYNSKTVAVSNAVVYGYYMRPGSITKSAFSRKKLDYLDIAKQRADFFKENDEPILYASFLFVYSITLLDYANKVNIKLKDESLAKNLKKEYNLTCKELIKFKGMSLRRKFILLVFRYFPFIYTLFNKIALGGSEYQ